MSRPQALTADQLYRACPPEELGFATTSELEEFQGALGQARAVEALRFGTAIPDGGYNLFVLGPNGIGKHALVQQFLGDEAARRPTPPDWCYLFNFRQPNRPRLLRLAAGSGTQLREDLQGLVQELRAAIPAIFESEEYHARLQELQQAAGEREQEAFRELQQDAERQGIALLQTPFGFTFAPRKGGEVMEPQEFQALPEEERKRLEQAVEELQERMQKVLQQLPKWRKERLEQVKELNEQMAQAAVGNRIAELQHAYRELPEVGEHLAAIRDDVVDNVEAFLGQSGQGVSAQAEAMLSRYQVNVLVDNGEQQGAPVVYADLPTYQHLTGRVEHQVQQGALVTDFTLIRAGALHEANGGYLILDVRKLLLQPFAWEGLKRALYSGEARIESLERLYSMLSTASLEPEPMPLDVKVVLLGDRMLYYLLAAYDPDFEELFKVQADFEEDLERSPENQRLYARLIGSMVRHNELLPFERCAVARTIEHSSRLAADSRRLSTHTRTLADLLREASHWACAAGAATVTAAHVQQAIDKQLERAGRVRDRSLRAIVEDTILIDTDGEHVGQVNGLSVLTLGNHMFGRPTRITASVRLGRGQLIDIEREAKLGGAIHSKGVMILSGFLGGRYGADQGLSLTASLAFEQSYGMIDGDSASVAELCALLSALAELPLAQSLAVTGSVNQHGRVQAVGGVNEKIEGFFDVCQARGLSGAQGVLLPAANVPDLMLRADVREAVAAGRFAVYPIQHVDGAIELLLGRPAGVRDGAGRYPDGSVNQLVEARLSRFASEARRAAGAAAQANREGDNGG